MKLGVHLITFGPGASPESLARWAAFAENVGYHFVMVGDHVAITPDVQGRYPAPFHDPFTTLAWVAGITRRVELGFTVIVLPYRHPLETARMAANLDRLSGGRLIFGIGVGWARQEFEVLGLPFEQRGAMTDDYIAAIKAAWTQDVASHHGRFVSFKDVHTAPRPIRTPHPPVWVGGSSDAALLARCATAPGGIPSAVGSRGSATRASRSSAPSPRRKSGPRPRCARASGCA